MAPLSCPLCCNEVFSSHISLKYHILSMVDNLICPSCCEKCDDLMDLADHLGRECKNLRTPSSEEKGNKTSNFKVEASQKEPEESEEVPKTSTVPDEPRVKTETLDDSFENGNDGSKIIDIDESGNVNENEVEETNDEDEVIQVYTCQMCNMTFESVQDHLAKYHEGEEVLLETEEDIHAESQGEEETALGYPSPDEAEDDIFEDEGSIPSERTGSRMGETISEEERVDKDGMNYTRKVVKIGTGWINDKQEAEPDSTQSAENSKEIEPVTTKYIVEDGKVRKLTEEEASEVTDRTKIIEVHNCPNCNLQFPNMSHFKKHNCNNAKPIVSKRKEKKEKLLKVKEELRYQCTFCLAIYSSLIALNDHMKAHLIKDESGMVHKKTITMTLHVCEVCNTKFPTYKQLRLHSRMHDPVKDKEVDPPVSYNIMGQSTTEENDDTNNSERETFQCPICEKLYDKQYEDVHLKSHEDQENIVCLVCNRKFDNKENLEMHMKAHSNTKKFACSYCKKPFNSYQALEDHVLNQCQKRQYECQYCGRRFGRPHEKVKHERIHTGEKPHVCQVCGRAFRVSYCLTLHMRTHTNTRPYTCQHCGKRFKSHSVFNHHMQTHSDERNYKCPFCPKAFKTAVQLAGHKNSHTKPFSCNECNRPFASLYAVRAHMETHKRDNNLKFDCWICGASYARSFALKDHMISVHENSADAKETVKGHDGNILIELEHAPDENQMDHSESQDTSEGHHEQVEVHLTEGNEYHIEVNDGEVLGGHEDAADEGYIVHLQPVENSEHIESQMEVVES